eukprot:4564451-Amphidinium_carterae.1
MARHTTCKRNTRWQVQLPIQLKHRNGTRWMLSLLTGKLGWHLPTSMSIAARLNACSLEATKPPLHKVKLPKKSKQKHAKR